MVSNTAFSLPLDDMLYTKITRGVDERYNKDTYNLFWDLDLRDRLKAVYDDNKEVLDKILYSILYESIKEYRVENYVFSERISQILMTDPSYQEKIKQLLDTRLNDILDKI